MIQNKPLKQNDCKKKEKKKKRNLSKIVYLLLIVQHKHRECGI